MTELEPAARKLILDAGHADDPSHADQERVRRALAASLGAAAFVTAAVPGAAAASAAGATTGAAAAGAVKLLSISQLVVWFGMGAAGGASLSAAVATLPLDRVAPAPLVVPAKSSERATAPVVVPAARTVEATPSPPIGEPESPLPRSVPLAPMRAEQAKPATDGSGRPPAVVAFPEPEPSAFAAELRLMEQAQVLRANGRCGESLQRLAEHAERFPNGALESERRTLEHLLRSCSERGPAGGATIP